MGSRCYLQPSTFFVSRCRTQAYENDKFGGGIFYVGFSDGLKDGLRLAGIPARDECGLEIFYNLAHTPWLRVTADAQIIRPPVDNRDPAIVGGLRAVAAF